MKNIAATVACVLCAVGSFAQRDTTKKQTIDITSSYKPVLRNAVKINLSASNLSADTSKSVMPYSIPAQNLFYTYQPFPLKPIALTQDSSLDLGTRNYLKAGFGNYSTPFLDAGFSFGDGKTSLVNLYAGYIASKGSIEFQDYSKFFVKGAGSYFTERNEFYGSAALSQQDYHLYGYDHNIYKFTKDSLLQRYTDVSLKVGMRNKDKNETGISYNPTIEVTSFSNKNKLSESSLVIDAPVEKTFGDDFTFKVALKADITSVTVKNQVVPVKQNNNIFYLAPELVYASPAFTVHAGVTPAWDNSKLSVLPNIYGEAQIKDKVFLVQAGIVGRYIKNTYRNLTVINPYLDVVPGQLNTREIELYGGIKASVGKHFNFSAKAGFVRFKNLPFYINDTATDNKAFLIANESSVSDLRIHGDVSFISQDKFTITGGLTLNGYTAMKDNAKAWGTIPLEITASMRWWAFKQVMIKGDFKTFTGGPYILAGPVNKTLSGAADLSAGVEFSINKMFSAWMDLNNLFNNKYQRWNNYQVYGLNVLAGVIVKF